MKKAKKAAVLMLVLTLCMSMIAGCSAPNDANGTSSVANGNQGEGTQTSAKDTLNVIVNADVSQFSPYITNSFTDIMALYQIYDRLVYFVDGEAVPQLAESWNVSEDMLTYVFNIRQDSYFHNGERVTAEDVVYSIEKNLARPNAAGSRAKYKSVTALDENTVEIVLNYPVSSILSNLASPGMGVVSKKYVEEKGDDAFLSPVGSGAYMLKEWRKGSKIQMEAYENYGGGAAPIKYLNFNIIGDSSTALVSLETGDGDFIVNVAESNISLIQGNDNLVLQTAPSHTAYTLVLNIRNGMLQDQKLRQAIAYAIDRESINTVAFEGTGVLSTGSFPDFLNYSGKDYSYEYNIERARELMKEAGYPDGGITLTIKTADAYGDVVPQMVQSNLAEIGIDLKIEMLEMNAHSQDYLNANFEIIYAGGSSITPDLGESLYSSYYWPDNTWSPSSPDDDRFNELLNKIKAETDYDLKTDLCDTMMEQLHDLCNEIQLITKTSNIVFRKGLQNTYVDPNGMYYCFKDFSWQ